MQGNNNHLTFLQVIRLENVELWEVTNDRSHLKTKSFLQVLYSHINELFLLRIGDFKCILDKSLEIIRTISGKDNYHSYLIPSPEGFFIAQVPSQNATVPIANFETVLKHTVSFLQWDGFVEILEPYKKNEGVFQRVEESVVEGLMGFAGSIKRAFSPYSESHPNQLIVRDFKELKDVNSHLSPVIDIPEEEVNFLRNEVKEVNMKLPANEQWKNLREKCMLGERQEPVGVSMGETSRNVTETIMTTQVTRTTDENLTTQIPYAESENMPPIA